MHVYAKHGAPVFMSMAAYVGFKPAPEQASGPIAKPADENLVGDALIQFLAGNPMGSRINS